ncbi:MAG: DoxX-like family protein [Planctomycetes bacterium]|nr:DoxX-like family protein [Planctomycetota bacterium]MCB9886659.1 DoxX-like family protein [Planctomycetota bacterium]
MLVFLRFGTAAVWIVFGLVFKVLHLVPRHERIVADVLGEGVAGPLTIAVGVAETLLGLWILSRRWPRACAAVQTAAIVCMNTLELTYAREHLLAPLPMVLANTVFLTAGWWLALRTARSQGVR